MFLLSTLVLPSRRPRARTAVATVSAIAIACATLAISPASAATSVGSDRSQIAQLEQEIAAQGARIEILVGRYNAVEGRIGVLDARIAHEHVRLAADQRAQRAASVEVRRVAVSAYMTSAGMSSPTLVLFGGTANVTTAIEQNNYLSAANTRLNDELTAFDRDQSRTQATQKSLGSQQAQARASLRQVATARDAANAAIASDEAALARVNGNLRSLLAAAQARHEATERADERALATKEIPQQPQPQPQPIASPPSSTPPPLSPPISPSPGGYANPLRAISALSPERIDQGVDYSGFGSIYAIGDGVVLSTVNGGWPGGTFIAYRLTDGPANGLVVYAAEDIEPTVQVGQSVTSGTVLGQMYAGPTGIETGWANPSGDGDTMARTYQQFDGSNSTAFGYNFSLLLQSVGAPGGVLENNPATGQLPPGWPQW